MDLNLLKPQIKAILTDKGYRLMNVHFLNEGDERYLRVIVDKYHHTVNLDEIVSISEAIDQLIDVDAESEPFTLDVTTTGAEKEVPLHEVDDYLNTYLSVTLNDGIKGPPVVTGTLVAVSNERLSITTNLKGRIKNIDIPRGDIKSIKRALKF
ncbi:MAG: hypothetical protein WC968_03835 [Bacilli bacterium]